MLRGNQVGSSKGLKQLIRPYMTRLDAKRCNAFLLNSSKSFSDMSQAFQEVNYVVILVGKTGAGKTSLIDTVTNHFFNVQFTDDFRYTLKSDEEIVSDDQTESQTKEIAVYILNNNTMTLALIDTPGFADTDGNTDKEIPDMLKNVVDEAGQPDINGVCFVVNGTDTRIGETEVRVFRGVLQLFPKTAKCSTFACFTHVCDETPPENASKSFSKGVHGNINSKDHVEICFENEQTMFGIKENNPTKSKYRRAQEDFEQNQAAFNKLFVAINQSSFASKDLSMVITSREKADANMDLIKARIARTCEIITDLFREKKRREQQCERIRKEREELERFEREREQWVLKQQEEHEENRIQWEIKQCEIARQKREEHERLKQERLQRIRIEQERWEEGRKEWEDAERERIEQGKMNLKKYQKALEKFERERVERERLERDRVEQERIEWERGECERLEQEREEQQRMEQERVEMERAEQERLEKERIKHENDKKLKQQKLDELIKEAERDDIYCVLCNKVCCSNCLFNSTEKCKEMVIVEADIATGIHRTAQEMGGGIGVALSFVAGTINFLKRTFHQSRQCNRCGHPPENHEIRKPEVDNKTTIKMLQMCLTDDSPTSHCGSELPACETTEPRKPKKIAYPVETQYQVKNRQHYTPSSPRTFPMFNLQDVQIPKARRYPVPRPEDNSSDSTIDAVVFEPEEYPIKKPENIPIWTKQILSLPSPEDPQETAEKIEEELADAERTLFKLVEELNSLLDFLLVKAWIMADKNMKSCKNEVSDIVREECSEDIDAFKKCNELIEHAFSRYTHPIKEEQKK